MIHFQSDSDNLFLILNFRLLSRIMKKENKELMIKVVLHVLVWAVLLGLPFYSARRVSLDNDFLLIYYSFTLINALIFYSNYLFLVPVLFFQKSRFRYYISAIGLLVIFYFVSDFTSNRVFGYLQEKNAERRRNPDERRELGPPGGGLMGIRFPPGHAFLTGYMSSSLFMIFLSLGLKVLERQTRIEKMQEEMEKERLNTELAFLKNQVSPHFFFNTLNNIYSLISVNQEDSQEAMLKLSKLMRYLLYESEHGNTMLSQEIDFMNNYIDLMKLRMSDKVSLSVRFPEKYDDRKIPPLLFVPFIENAFKHGISYRGNSFINIAMEIPDDSIIFRCSNSLQKAMEEVTARFNGGVGLDNVRKRLNLLFPSSHELRIDKSEKQYDVYLEIKSA